MTYAYGTQGVQSQYGGYMNTMSNQNLQVQQTTPSYNAGYSYPTNAYMAPQYAPTIEEEFRRWFPQAPTEQEELRQFFQTARTKWLAKTDRAIEETRRFVPLLGETGRALYE